jgi:hypothetical protein
VKIDHDLIDGISPATPVEDGSPLESKFDIEYKESSKKHRNSLSNLDYIYRVISHKSTIVIILFIVFLVFVITRYAGIVLDDKYKSFVLKISQDAGTALTYLLTIIGTSVFTKFLEKNDKD